MTISGPSPELSREVLGAIQKALAEEKASPGRRLAKVVLSSLACTAILAAPMLLAFREQMNSAWLLATGVWWLCLLAGFYLYSYPQPRLAVPGFWSPWIFAKVLLTMVAMTGVEILLCPSFVFLASPLPWSPFEGLAHLFMSWGGMDVCMFSCGFIFSGIGGLISFALVSRTLKRSTWSDVLKVTGVAYSTQLPIIGIQLVEPHLRPYAVFWMMGGLAGTFVMAGLVRFLAPAVTRQERHQE